ncbi:c-type cytochrome [Moraxella sp. K127]|uniref:cytochrome-c peroxidase n=1 Tax=Moraxella sp. K127 TaxID=2780079 RepID=UPI00187FC3F4|nr:cytochrome c peroxidase [Moraxella sp. K127]MBE9590713.1 c-type cytochrome [Moraxella sp. K127]
MLRVVFVVLAIMFGTCQAVAHTSSGECDIQCLRLAYAKPTDQWLAPTIDDGVAWAELAPIGTPPMPTPLSELGKRLFFETALSSDGQIACITCHDPRHAFADPRPVSLGVYDRQGTRNSQSLTHLGLDSPQHAFFWDGRAKTLHEQVLMPLTDPNEMNITLDSVPSRLANANYLPRFRTVFGQQMTAIDINQVAHALTAYLHTLTPTLTRFDEFLKGDITALSDAELLGLHLFRTKGRCMNCHFGQAMSDGDFHNLNQTLAGRTRQDFGKYDITGDPADFGKFKTPSLRNLSTSKPWFHHGLFTNLRGVVAIYNTGMDIPPTSTAPPIAHADHLDPLIKPLGLTADEMDALTAFLLTL